MERLISGYGLLEGPRWKAGSGLVFSDVENGGVFLLGLDGDVETLVEHRRGIGGIALHEDGGLVVGGRNIAYCGPAAAEKQVLLDQDCIEGITGFNDLTADAHGRVYVGSLGASPFGDSPGEPPGYLHRIDLDGSTHVLAPDIKLTNGLGFSPAGNRLYHCDTLNQFIGMYRIGAGGEAGKREIFARIPDGGGPDGLAVAADGSIYCALADGGVVAVFDEDGSMRESIDVPHPMPTSVCFGGEDLDELYIVTGNTGDHPGTIFRMAAGVSGFPVPPARIAIR